MKKAYTMVELIAFFCIICILISILIESARNRGVLNGFLGKKVHSKEYQK